MTWLLICVHFLHLLLLLLHLLLIHLPSLTSLTHLILLSLDLLGANEANGLLVESKVILLDFRHLVDLVNRHAVEFTQLSLEDLLHAGRQLRLAHRCI